MTAHLLTKENRGNIRRFGAGDCYMISTSNNGPQVYLYRRDPDRSFIASSPCPLTEGEKTLNTVQIIFLTATGTAGHEG